MTTNRCDLHNSNCWWRSCAFTNSNWLYIAKTNVMPITQSEACVTAWTLLIKKLYQCFTRGRILCKGHRNTCNLKRLDMECIALVSSVPLVSNSVLGNRGLWYIEYPKHTHKEVARSPHLPFISVNILKGSEEMLLDETYNARHTHKVKL